MTDSTVLIVVIGAIVLVVAVACIFLLFHAISGILTHPTASSGEKALWIVLVVIFPLLGPLIWFAGGRRSVGSSA